MINAIRNKDGSVQVIRGTDRVEGYDWLSEEELFKHLRKIEYSPLFVKSDGELKQISPSRYAMTEGEMEQAEEAIIEVGPHKGKSQKRKKQEKSRLVKDSTDDQLRNQA